MLKAIGFPLIWDGVGVGVVRKHRSEKAKFDLGSQQEIGVN